MSTQIILFALVAAGIAAYFVGIARAAALDPADGDRRNKLHSRLGYYGAFLMILTALPALIVTMLWAAIAPTVIDRAIRADLPEQIQALSGPEQALVMGRINTVAEGVRRLGPDDRRAVERARLGFSSIEDAAAALQRNGVILGSAPEPYVIRAAYDRVVLSDANQLYLTIAAAVLAILGFVLGFVRIRPRLKARGVVEAVMLGGLIAASSVAVLTTLGIILSVLFESIHFFQMVSPENFYLGTVWDPRFSSVGRTLSGAEGQFGFLPLLWGTLYISLIALLVSVPIGLFAAIYLSEYASNGFRSTAKPLLEVLAGIPTIVYGFFALITFGPMMRDYGALAGLQINAISVFTAGVVMGIMIIPYVSSLSDDIISAVPQSLREGSLGLGATKSETIKRVVLPAALPGIVGAILLAASRAIGETMIVVLAAGAAANMSINPFEPMTTITVKIVSQLTGDLEFNSPQTLVAFALGLTLFVITLVMNVYALYIVRKYKEQYD